MSLTTEENEILNKCKSRWKTEDTRTKYFEENYDSYINGLTPNMKEYFLSFLQNFSYYPHDQVNAFLKELHQKLLAEDIDIDKDTAFVALKSKRKTINSSYLYLSEYYLINNVSSYNVFPEIRDLNEDEICWSKVRNIVIVDDFCGSGNTFRDFIRPYSEDLKDKRVIYIVIQIMEKAKACIHQFAEENDLDIEILEKYCERAAFQLSSEIMEKREDFQKESECLDIYGDNNIFGWEQTESLAAFYNNTPNDTLGVFWKNTNKNSALFPRKENLKPAFMGMKSNRKSRKAGNYVRQTGNQ